MRRRSLPELFTQNVAKTGENFFVEVDNIFATIKARADSEVQFYVVFTKRLDYYSFFRS